MSYTVDLLSNSALIALYFFFLQTGFKLQFFLSLPSLGYRHLQPCLYSTDFRRKGVPTEVCGSLMFLSRILTEPFLMGLSHCSPSLSEVPALPQGFRFQCYLRLTKDAEKPWPGISSDWKTAVNMFPDVTMGPGATSPQLVANRVSLVSKVPPQTCWGQKHDLMLTVFTCNILTGLGLNIIIFNPIGKKNIRPNKSHANLEYFLLRMIFKAGV